MSILTRTTAYLCAPLLIFLICLSSSIPLLAQTDSCTVTNISTSLGNNVFIPTNETVSVILTNDHDDNSNYIYVTTRKEGSAYFITGFLDSPTVTFNSSEAAGEPIIIWGFSYTGTILAQVGDDAMTTLFSTGCYNVSRNCVMFFSDDEPPEPTTIITCGNASGTIIISGAPNTVFILYDSTDLSDSLTTVTTDSLGNAQVSYITDDDSEDYLVQISGGQVTSFSCPGITVMNPTQIIEVECMDTTRMITVQGNSNASYSIFDDADLAIRLGGGTAGLTGVVRIIYIVPLSTPLTDIDFLVADADPDPIGLRFNCTGSLQGEDDPAALNVYNPTLTANESQSVVASIYPNPALEQLYLRLQNLPVGETMVSIFNQQGQLVQQQVLQQDYVEESVDFSLPIYSLKSGFHFIRLSGAGFNEQVSFNKR